MFQATALEHHAHLVHPDITVISKERAHFKKGANNVRGDGSKTNRMQQHATGACQVHTRKTTIASIARSTQHPQTLEGALHVSRALTSPLLGPRNVKHALQDTKKQVRADLASAPIATPAKSVQRPEQTARTVHPVTLSPKRGQRSAILAFLDFIN